jgi:class 3 adenylate cyclase
MIDMPEVHYAKSGDCHIPYQVTGDADAYLDRIEEFLTGERFASSLDRVLATVLFADIVGSTERAAALGDARWRALLHGFQALARRQLERFRGVEIATLRAMASLRASTARREPFVVRCPCAWACICE